MKKSKWDARATRYERMREAWIDAMRSGTTKLPFAQFEERMLERDKKIKKVEYFNRRINVDWKAIELALSQTN